MFGFFRRRRQERLRASPLPSDWAGILDRNAPFCASWSEADRRELQGLVQVFLAEKHFEGCNGLELTDEIKVTIAAHACRLLLHRDSDVFPRLVTVLVYPTAYVARAVESLGGGAVLEGEQVRLGEAWKDGVAVVSWDDLRATVEGRNPGRNLVLHEFAHILDMEDGASDGTPVLPGREQYASWIAVMEDEYERLRRDQPSRALLGARSLRRDEPGRVLRRGHGSLLREADGPRQASSGAVRGAPAVSTGRIRRGRRYDGSVARRRRSLRSALSRRLDGERPARDAAWPARRNAASRARGGSPSPRPPGERPWPARRRPASPAGLPSLRAATHRRRRSSRGRPGAVEDDRPHADQAVVLDRAAVQDDPVADGHPLADGARHAGVGVDHRQVLDIGLVADRDPVGVAAQDGVVPDAGLGPEVDVAEHDRAGGDEGRWDRSWAIFLRQQDADDLSAVVGVRAVEERAGSRCASRARSQTWSMS